jgi:hypothetical protein
MKENWKEFASWLVFIVTVVGSYYALRGLM